MAATDQEGRALRVPTDLILKIVTILLAVGGSWGLIQYSLGSLETTVAQLEVRAVEDRAAFIELEARTRVDHDLVVTMAADLRYIRHTMAGEKK